MGDADLYDADLQQIAARGMRADDVHRQLRQLRAGCSYRHLERACGRGDGIRVLAPSEIERLQDHYQAARAAGRLLKFVPASGAATRMFKSLLRARERNDANREAVAARGDAEAHELLQFMDGFARFAFAEDLRHLMQANGLDAAALAARGCFGEIIDYLLAPHGLDYAALPKGLVRFHRYATGSRTAFEEHLREAAGYLCDDRGVYRLHFTISPQHRERFAALLGELALALEQQLGVRFEVGFSEQKPSTDTVAVGLDNRPFRTDDGRLLFRPGGHGALIENLNDLAADIVCINNIDNVLPDYRQPIVIKWRQALIGLLVAVQREIFAHLSALDQPAAGAAAVGAAARFVQQQLALEVTGSEAEQRAALTAVLDRPLRVCGVVANAGEPGGGPFWVRGPQGRLSVQIVEGAEVDPASPAQQAVFRSASHFNPVDLVCGVRDRRGRSFELSRFVDPEAVFIAHKSEAGRNLKALERPGLWNGAMARWITLLVEVPATTFCPVKTVTDLLRPQHQPE
ncbi:MAG: DUF4301 family protein [Deltaproteobacteria bacterium]|nr:DUF4301 family protein [Deltaproteobacteria bacterium]